MQAIETKFISPTNHRGPRIKATAAAGSITIPYPYELSGQTCHRAAAEALRDKLQWGHGPLIGGQLANGNYVFVFNNVWGNE